ncbi:MAG: class I SAM-dependent methyltransferase [Bacteroidales bacterium]
MAEIITKNDFYAGYLYAKFWDPIMKETSLSLSKHVPDNSKVIDVASGTGRQLFALASRIELGTGLDLSDRMKLYAENMKFRNGFTNLSFEVGDASDLSRFANGSFDISMATLLFHEIATEKRLPILLEMKRVSNMVIIADYTVQRNFSNLLISLLENTIGIMHSHHYKSYRSNGGMPTLLKESGLAFNTYETTMRGTLGIWSCKSF